MATEVGGYVLETRLGSGASGAVWRARRSGTLQQVVAVKRLHDTDGLQVARLKREAEVLLALDHPHLVRVLDVVDDGDGVALVLQLAPGGSLDSLLAERGQLTAGEVVALAAPLADALASAHRRGIVHGDVKPANVLFTSDGEPLLTDFGVARLIGRSVTADQRVAGTAEYLAPELLDGVAAHPGSDIYALGAVCYEALTGAPPYTGPTPMAVLRAADRGEHAPLTGTQGVPSTLAALVEAAVNRNQGARPASAEDFARRLRASVEAGSIRLPSLPAGAATAGGPGTRSFGPEPPRPRHERRKPPSASRFRARRGMVVALALAIAAVAWFVVDPGDDGPPPPCAGAVPTSVAGAQVVQGDTSGTGCVTTGNYAQEGDKMVLSIRVLPTDPQPSRYGIGRPGDAVLLGDWNCDGVDTIALHRLSTGEVIYFDEWVPHDTQALPSRTEQVAVDADVGLGTDDDGCDAVVEVEAAE